MSYYERHRKKMLNYSKNKYNSNKDKFAEYNKEYYQKNKEHLIQRMKDRYKKRPRVYKTAEQKHESHLASLRKYYRKMHALEIKEKKDAVVKKIERLEVEYTEEGLIKLELSF